MKNSQSRRTLDKAIPIQSRNGEHLGFVLFANNEADPGECVVIPIPNASASFDNSDFLMLRDLGAKESGEHKWTRSEDIIQIALSIGGKAVIDLSTKTLLLNDRVQYQIV